MEPKLCKPVDVDGRYVCSVCGFDNGDPKPFTRLCGTREERLEQLGHIRGSSVVMREGAGEELKRILSMLGINPKGGCACNARAAQMNRNGPEWCREHIDEIIGWLEKEAHRRELPFSRFVAKALVLLAIRRAEKKQRKQE